MPLGSKRIQELRTKRGWSQLQLATNADLCQRTVQFAESGSKQMKVSVLESIADALEVKYEEVVDDADDSFRDWPWGLSKFIRNRCFPEDYSFCATESDAIDAIRKMRASWQLHLGNTRSNGTDSMFGKADQILESEYDAYEARYLAIWKKNHDALFFGISSGVRVGMTVVLPVTDAAYERLRDGKCTFMDITAADVLPESQNLILDSAVEFVNASRKRWFQVTDALGYAVFHQIASLSIAPNERSFRVLSFGASPINLGRLATNGLVPNTKRMPKYQYSICELTGDNSDLDVDSYNMQSTWRHFLALWKRMLPGDTLLRLKRRLILRAVTTFKALLESRHRKRFAA